MWQHKVAEDRCHEWVRTFGEELIDPELESSSESELGSEDFIFTKYEKEQADGHAEKGDGPVVEIVNSMPARRHGGKYRSNSELGAGKRDSLPSLYWNRGVIALKQRQA